jgi:hypothetical protein
LLLFPLKAEVRTEGDEEEEELHNLSIHCTARSPDILEIAKLDKSLAKRCDPDSNDLNLGNCDHGRFV